jgi:hypothetical protein
MSEETATIDPKDVRTQLGLAADAPDADVIVELLKLIAQLTAQIETLTGQAAQSEKELANRILERYADRISAGTEPFWAEQILTNREAAVGVLEKLPAPALPDPPPDPDSRLPASASPLPAPGSRPPSVPLRNRLAAPDARPDNPGATTPPADAARAVAIRNRAHEIRAREGVPFLVAFSRAERELPEAR